MPNKNNNIQGMSLNVVNDFPYYEELLIKEKNLPLGANSFL